MEHPTVDLRSAYASGRRRIGAIRVGVAAAIAVYAIAYRPLPGHPEAPFALPLVLLAAAVLAAAGGLRWLLGSRVDPRGEAAFLFVDVGVAIAVNAAFVSDPRHELRTVALLVLAETAVVVGLRAGVSLWAAMIAALSISEIRHALDGTVATSRSLAAVPILATTALLVVLIAGLLARELTGERRRRLDAQERDLDRLEDLVHGLGAIVWEADLEARFTFISRQAEALLGYPSEQWLADPGFWPSIIHPDDRAAAVRFCREATSQGRDHDFEYRTIAIDGSVRWMHDIVRVVKGSDGQPVRLQGVMLDVTARREAETRYQALIEHLPGVTYLEVVDGDRDFLYMSPQVEKLTGFPAEAWRPGDFWLERIHPDDRERVHAHDQGTNVSGEPYEIEYRVLTRDGRTIWLHDRAVLLEGGPDGRMVWQGFFHDVTREKETEAELQESIQALRAADRERRRLLARLVTAQEEERRRIAGDIHDDPVQKMTAVGLRLQALRARMRDPEDVRAVDQAGGTVMGAIERLRRLLFELRPPALDRDGLATALRQYLTEHADEAGYDFSLADRLVTEPPPEIRAIAYRIAQEALVNVRKHAGAGRVDVTLEERERGLFVRIRDDGVGFDPAGPGHASPEGHLGISSMRERAELAGGWWRIDSRRGAGTIVEFWLPCHREGALRAVG